MGHKGPVLRPSCIETQLNTICSMFKWLLDQFLLSLDVFSPLQFARAHTHTHTRVHTRLIRHISGICRITIYVLTFLSDYPVHCLPNNTHQLYAHSTLCMSRRVTRRHFSLNALFHTSQVDGHSIPCMC